MSDAPNFMQSPLAVWIQTFSFEPVSYKDLVDGIYLNEVLLQIDPKSSLEGIKNNVEDSKDKMINWELLLKNIRLFYQDVLDYYIVMKPPNIYAVCTHPESELARLEVRKTLQLLLGCAINCEMKEVFIGGMTSLPEDVQVSMMGYIQELQDMRSNVIGSNVIGSRRLSDELETGATTVYGHLVQLIQQRDEYLQEIRSLRLAIDEAEFDQSFLHSISIFDNGVPEVISRFSSSVTTKSHKNRLIVELAECKAKLRKLRQDLEDRDDAISELEMEADSLKQTVQKFKNENLELTRNVRAIKSFQDELDVIRDKASRCDRLDAEIQRYKEKMADLDFYKSRVEELRLDNSTLFENRSVMEEQLKAAYKRIETVVVLENELQKCKEQRDTLIVECDRLCIQTLDLIEENARLEQEKQAFANARIEDELQVAVDSVHKDASASLYDQLSQAVDSQVLKLEQENQALKHDLEQIRESTMLENASGLLALEKEKSRLAAEVDRFLETSRIEEQRYLELKHTNEELTQEKKSLLEAIEVLKETSERQTKELEEENHRLSQTIEALRERSEKTDDLRTKDLEVENKKLGEDVKQFVARVALLEQEQRTLNHAITRLTDRAERCRVLEMENGKLESENEELKRTLQVSTSDRSRLEKEISALEYENQKLVQTVETLQETASGKERLELENASLASEIQSLKRDLDSAASSLSRVGVLEKETRDLNLRLEQSAEQYKQKELWLEKLEGENASLNAEKQRDKESLASLEKRIKECEHDIGVRDAQNAELSRKIDDLKRSYERLEDVEKRLNDLESEMEATRKDKLVICKENKKLKKNLLAKESAIDDLTSKLTELDHEIKTLSPLIERSKDVELNLSELEKENLRIVQSATTDKRTIGVLQEDLVKEKIRCQQLQTDLENLRHQLSSSGNTDKKSGIDEVDSLMKKMHSEVDSSKPSEVHGPSKERTVVVTQRYSNSPSATQDIINLKDHIAVLETKNAALEEENRNVKRQNSELQGHIKQLQSQISQWQFQLPSLQTQISNLQSQLATAEVENRMLLAENASVSSQNFHLQEECGKTEALVSSHQRQNEELMRNHDALERDLEKFHTVHDQLTAEHEALIVKYASLKDVYRGSKSDVKHLQQRCSELTREKETMVQLKTVLETDRESRKTESQHQESLRADYIRVREDNLRLLNAVDKASGELQERQKELRVVKGEVLQLKARNDELAVENAGLGKQISERNAEYSKQVFRLEETNQWTAKLEEENRALMAQMKLFISQNQNLVTKLLECKDQHIVEQKAYLERLTELRQQKEKLEERYMEQYRRYGPAKNKQRSIASSFVKRAKQMIKGKMRENGSMGSSMDSSGASDALENTSCDPGIKRKTGNAGAEGDDVPITLDEFLLECNQSPKSRRKLLVEKQVSLDERVDTVSDITQKPLRPRWPTIHDESGDDLKCLLKPFQSEINISFHGDWEPLENYLPLPHKPRARSAAASSCAATARDEFIIGKGIDQQQMQWCHRSGRIPERDLISPSCVSQFGRPTGFSSVEQNTVPFRAKRTARYIRSQSYYEGLWRPASAGHRETVKPDSVKDAEDWAAKRETTKRPASLSSGYASRETESCDLPNPSVNLGLVKGRPELPHVEGQQRIRGLASEDQQSVRPSSTMGSSTPDDPELGSRCCPGTVRDLVHSFQQAVKPSTTTDLPHQSTANNNKAVRPHSTTSSVPNSPPIQSNYDVLTLRVAADSQFKLKDVKETVADPRQESNVCVVRPASGRALPSNPSDQLDTNVCRIGSNSDSMVDPAEGALTSRPVSAETAKNKSFSRL